MALILPRICYKYTKCVVLSVIIAFFVQIFIAFSFFPTINDNYLVKDSLKFSSREEAGHVSARKNYYGYTDDEDFVSTKQQNKPPYQLRVEELDFKPICEIKSREAISAIHRAKSQMCKHEIVNISCLIQDGHFYPESLPNLCLNNGKTYGKYIGCFTDDKKLRLLSGFYGNYANSNSRFSCLDICVQGGFSFAGVQYASECFCGDSLPPSSAKVTDDYCNMKCPGHISENCGGYFTMNIFETGLNKFIPRIPIEESGKNSSVRLVFLLTLNGRALRQVHRLINVLYRTNHYFYIHVDKRQDYLHRKLSALEKIFSNVKLASNRFSTIWGGASLLTMLLAAMKDFFVLGWQWDFVINLSESDFPIKSLESLETFLAANKGVNFVKSHGREVQRFIKKQGLDKTFLECETHMWRIGERKLPRGVVVDGGSDWLALSPEFVSYVISERDQLLQGLNTVFKHTLLPAESFFHTVLRNSQFCDTYVDNNLHVTNWKRKMGCKCQYKHVVDWCGCSPNDFLPEDWPRIQNTRNKQLFFARKFEPIINQEIINRVEQFIGFDDHDLLSNLHAYWQNIYDHQDLTSSTDDTLLTHAESLVRHNAQMLSQLECPIIPIIVMEINSYSLADVYKGNLIMYRALLGNNAPVLIETWIKPKSNMDLNIDNKYSQFVKVFRVSSEYDQKEATFRNLANILGPLSEPVLLYQLSHNVGKMKNFTVVWLDASGVVADVNEIYIEENNLTNFIKPQLKPPLLPGVWRASMYDGDKLIVSTQFLVTPLEYFSGKELTSQEASIIHGGAQSSYKNFTNIKAVSSIPNREEQTLLQKKSNSNIKRLDKDLRDWIDSLTIEFYNILGFCVSQNSHLKDNWSCGNLKIELCESTSWSSLAPDPKGSIGKINKVTGRLDRT